MQYVNTEQLMEEFKISRATLFRYRQKGMPYHKDGTNLLFDKEEVKTWIALNQNKKEDAKLSMLGNGITIKKRFVTLLGFLPKFPELHGSCALEFTRIAGVITLNPEDIMRLFTKGLDTSYNAGMRPYILHNQFDTTNPYQIRLRGFSAFLDEAEIKEFCEVIDTFMSHYLNNIEEMLDIINPKSFSFSKLRTHNFLFRLFTIDKALWKKMIEFTRKFPIDESTNHLRFESSDHFIRVCNLEGMPSENYHVILRPEKVEDPYFNPIAPTQDDKIWLVAEIPYNYSLDKKELSDISPKNLWDTTTTEAWLKDYFVPSVVSYFEDERIEQPFNLFSLLKDSFRKGKEKEIYNRKSYETGIKKYTFKTSLDERLHSPFDVKNEKQLHDLISVLQSFYCSVNENFKLTAEEIQNLYQAFLNCLENVSDKNEAYPKWLADRVMSNHKNPITLEDLSKEIHEYIRTINDEEIYYSGKIENILRGFIEVTLGNNIAFSSEEDIQQTARMLYPIYKIMQQKKLYKSLENL